MPPKTSKAAAGVTPSESRTASSPPSPDLTGGAGAGSGGRPSEEYMASPPAASGPVEPGWSPAELMLGYYS